MFEEPSETHTEFRFLSRTTRDVVSGFMLLFATVGLFGLCLIMGRILWLLF